MRNTVSLQELDAAERAFIDTVVASHRGRPGALLGILEAVQEHHPRKYLPIEVLRYVGVRTKLPLSRIYSVATFYALFNLEPQGAHTVCICRGTACHTRGSRQLLESVKFELGLDAPGDSTDADKISISTRDGRFTVRTVACFGQCALAPVVEVDHKISGHVNVKTLEREIRAIEREND
ncbi:MAG TPA: NAD(P)H-dependent oxidoreductase subunit E [Vicinamibacterales bacterium]